MRPGRQVDPPTELLGPTTVRLAYPLSVSAQRIRLAYPLSVSSQQGPVEQSRTSSPPEASGIPGRAPRTASARRRESCSRPGRGPGRPARSPGMPTARPGVLGDPSPRADSCRPAHGPETHRDALRARPVPDVREPGRTGDRGPCAISLGRVRAREARGRSATRGRFHHENLLHISAPRLT